MSAPHATARSRRFAVGSSLPLLPFLLFVTIFLIVPTVTVAIGAFQDADGAFTTANLDALTSEPAMKALKGSLILASSTALIGGTLGALLAWAISLSGPTSLLKRASLSVSGVLAQFGGVMLAFAFVATIGIQGFITVLLRDQFGIDIFADGVWLYEAPGLVLPYIYFQVPLMIIIFMPALEALKPQWAEASATLGGTTATFWLRIGFPVLAPSFLGSLLLLFANAFSSYATAAALTSQGQSIVPLQIRAALTSETLLGRENLAGALALGMIVVMAIVMSLYALLQRRAARWQR